MRMGERFREWKREWELLCRVYGMEKHRCLFGLFSLPIGICCSIMQNTHRKQIGIPKNRVLLLLFAFPDAQF